MHRKPVRPMTSVFACLLAAAAMICLLLAVSTAKEPRRAVIYRDPQPDSAPSGDGSGAHDPDELSEAMRKLYDEVPEARDFAMGSLDDPEAPLAEDIDLSDLDLSSVPELYQWDTRWGYASYAGNYLGLSGCGPTCLSMAAIYLTGDTSLNPLYVADYAAANGYCYDGQGTAWALFTDGAAGLGVTSQELPLTQALIDSSLSQGKLVALVLGPGDFTDSGHFILITGQTSDGYTVLDPNDPANNQKTWSYSRLAPQIKDLWALS